MSISIKSILTALAGMVAQGAFADSNSRPFPGPQCYSTSNCVKVISDCLSGDGGFNARFGYTLKKQMVCIALDGTRSDFPAEDIYPGYIEPIAACEADRELTIQSIGMCAL